jgi:LacI family transcriptional regulator, gluconate utilization system Gnt-I transcriptional repressor
MSETIIRSGRNLGRPATVTLKHVAVRAKVGRAVAELGYLPNRVAGALASAESRVVPVIVPSLSNAVFIEVIQGVQDVLEVAGYQLLLGNTQYDLKREGDLTATLLGWSPAGVIIAGLRHADRTRAMLQAWRRPVVEVME